jgi:uncharacterized membrane protein YbhN (UPF0104 family)
VTARRAAGALLRLAVTAGLLALLLRLAEPADVGRRLAGVRPEVLAAAVLIWSADRLLNFLKWAPLLRVHVDAPLPRVLRVYYAAYAVSFVIPFSEGADALRAVALGRGRGRIAEAAASIVMERLLGFAALVVLGLAALGVAVADGLPLAPLLPWMAGGAAAAAGILALALGGPFAGRLRSAAGRSTRLRAVLEPAGRFVDACATYRRRPGVLLFVGALAVLEIALFVVTMLVLARALGLDVALPPLLLALPVALFLAQLPIAWRGLGVAEGGMVWVLGLFGVAAEAGLSLLLLFRLVDVGVAVPGAVLWRELLRAGRSDPQRLPGGVRGT